jgi:prophage regulatory protein
MRSHSKFNQALLQPSLELHAISAGGQSLDFFVGLKAVQILSDLSPSRIWELEQLGLFPKRIKIGPARVAWSLKEIQCWQHESKNLRSGKP